MWLTTMCMLRLNMLELSCAFYERCFCALKVMGKFTAAIYFPTEGLTLIVRSKPQATRLKGSMSRSRELPHALNTHQMLQLNMAEHHFQRFLFLQTC